MDPDDEGGGWTGFGATGKVEIEEQWRVAGFGELDVFEDGAGGEGGSGGKEKGEEDFHGVWSCQT